MFQKNNPKVFQKKITELKNKITDELTPLIASDYVLLNLPYHANIGDTLIWEGEESFLSSLPYKCLYRSSLGSYNRDKMFGSDITILLHGGGNFGDLWAGHQKFRLEIVRNYIDNPIVIFPQTVHYSEEAKVARDGELMSDHKNLTICVRDKRSYDLLKKYFSNNILLLPDMAFCIDPARLHQHMCHPDKDILLLKRTDKELSTEYDYKKQITDHGKIDFLDWPTKQKGNVLHKIINKPIHPKNPFKDLSDYYAYHVYRPYLIKKGVQFLSSYKHIYTTRLHGAILSTLLQKPYTFFDNSYGKNKGFFDAWLSDIEGISFIKG